MKLAYDENDLLYALENAVEFLRAEEFPHDNGEQEAANEEAARLIDKMIKRRLRKG